MEKVIRLMFRIEKPKVKGLLRSINDYLSDYGYKLSGITVWDSEIKDVKGDSIYLIATNPPIHVRSKDYSDYMTRKIEVEVQAVEGRNLEELCSTLRDFGLNEIQRPRC